MSSMIYKHILISMILFTSILINLIIRSFQCEF